MSGGGREFAFDRRAWSVLIWQLVSRAPSGMLNLGLVFFGEGVLGSYAIGGMLVAAYNIAYAIGSPLAARLLSLIGTAPVLGTYAIVSAGALAALVTLTPSAPGALILAAVAGFTFPPVTPLARSMYPRIVGRAKLEPVFAVDAIAQEFIWIVGPLVATSAAWLVGPSAALLIAAGVLLAGVSVFAALPATRRYGNLHGIAMASRSTVKGHLDLRLVAILIAVGFFLVGTGGTIELFVVAHFGYDNPAAGIALAAISVGSLVGGILIGKRPLRSGALPLRLGLALSGLVAATFSDNVIWLVIALFISGVGVAPAFAGLHTIIATRVPDDRTALTYSLSHSGQLIGLAVGTALAGALVESVSAHAALWASIGSMAIAVAIATAAPVLRRGLER
ncbi:MFS transporter [Ruicaihuangia caeni]|uniref:MFS transporter n=1 Tax=Ruicaihuangia caeni TaxID=3042517 RepID=A0AAW6T5H0_9MICO|nr:MFS transporter [Klugiella sp. YN-L-19]MDI2097618.1 MFS transporter [Klugiella sp. YN-L-19]